MEGLFSALASNLPPLLLSLRRRNPSGNKRKQECFQPPPPRKKASRHLPAGFPSPQPLIPLSGAFGPPSCAGSQTPPQAHSPWRQHRGACGFASGQLCGGQNSPHPTVEQPLNEVFHVPRWFYFVDFKRCFKIIIDLRCAVNFGCRLRWF